MAVVVAINPIWGFSWYFNTENWASAFWERVTEARTDIWREAMIAAVEREVLPTGVPREALFEVRPDGVSDATDFTFLVIGDPGEGDPSQASLRDRYLDLGRRPDVKFLVVSSDVIYPGGAMRDYEFNFYLPFKGFEKPIYAIPGNHDWFSALDGFAANLMEPVAAQAAMNAREQLTAVITPPDRPGVASAISEAARLRKEYSVRTGEQRAPFFEIHGQEFSLIAVDTGILRRIDPAQAKWLEEALSRARGRFTMVILGHPLYAGGGYQGTDEAFGSIHRLLRQYKIPIVMAGDTHDFEYYREEYNSERRPASDASLRQRRWRCLSQYRHCARLAFGSACAGLGVLPEHGGHPREARERDRPVEMAGLVVDQALQRLAGVGGSALRNVRLQSSPVLSELHGSSRGGLCATGAIDTAWRPRPAPLARSGDRRRGSSEGCKPGRPGRVDRADGETSGRLGRGLEGLWRCVERLQNGAASAFSVAATTRSRRWCGCTGSFWNNRSCRQELVARYLSRRFQDIRHFERCLTRNGVVILPLAFYWTKVQWQSCQFSIH